MSRAAGRLTAALAALLCATGVANAAIPGMFMPIGDEMIPCGGSGTTCSFLPTAEACAGPVSWAVANQLCRATNPPSLLCTLASLRSLIASDATGPTSDSCSALNFAVQTQKWVWARNTCSPPAGGHQTVKGGTGDQLRCHSNDQHFAVCCVDTSLLPTMSPTTASPTSTQSPTLEPTTAAPTTASPTTAAPTQEPTRSPTTSGPTTSPTTSSPTQSPTLPTASPTTAPTPPTLAPTTAAPTPASNLTANATLSPLSVAAPASSKKGPSGAVTGLAITLGVLVLIIIIICVDVFYLSAPLVPPPPPPAGDVEQGPSPAPSPIKAETASPAAAAPNSSPVPVNNSETGNAAAAASAAAAPVVVVSNAELAAEQERTAALEAERDAAARAKADLERQLSRMQRDLDSHAAF